MGELLTTEGKTVRWAVLFRAPYFLTRCYASKESMQTDLRAFGRYLSREGFKRPQIALVRVRTRPYSIPAKEAVAGLPVSEVARALSAFGRRHRRALAALAANRGGSLEIRARSGVSSGRCLSDGAARSE